MVSFLEEVVIDDLSDFWVFKESHGVITGHHLWIQWEFQDPKLEVC